ncbi:MAG: hypothetical protein ACHQUC_02435 [Chlamydiales bacterium]
MSITSGVGEAFKNIPLSGSLEGWNDRLYLTPNENCTDAFEKLTRQPITGNTVIGSSGLCTLNIVALRGIKAASNPEKIEQILLIDRSPCTEYFWESMQGIMTSSPDRATATDKIKAHLKENQLLYCQNIVKALHSSPSFARLSEAELREEIVQKVIDFLDQEIERGESFLSSDAYFAKIKRIFNENRCLFLRMDFQNEASMALLAERMKELHWSTDLIYLSNIAEFIDTERRDESVDARRAAYISSIDKLTRQGTLFLKTVWRKCRGCEPELTLALTRKSVKPLALNDMFPTTHFARCQSCRLQN